MNHKINYIDVVPEAVGKYFKKRFQGYDFRFYWYMFGNDKIYGCDVINQGHLYHNATQARLNWFIANSEV